MIQILGTQTLDSFWTLDIGGVQMVITAYWSRKKVDHLNSSQVFRSCSKYEYPVVQILKHSLKCEFQISETIWIPEHLLTRHILAISNPV